MSGVRALAVSGALLASLAVPAAAAPVAVPGDAPGGDRAPRAAAATQQTVTEEKPVLEAPPRSREDLPAGRVYTGPWNSDHGRAVQEAAPNYTGNYVCANGAMSGEHCAIKVFYVSPSDVTVRAERTKSGACAAVHGDSGGPVIAEAGGAIRGKGIISTGADAVTCWVGGSAMSGYHEIKYKSLRFVLGYFGATLKTW